MQMREYRQLRVSSWPAIFAHRGGAGDFFTQNSRAAFDWGLKAGADGLETDVHATRDGRLVIMHDAKLDTTTDAKGLVKDHDWSQLSEVRLRGGETLLSLEEFLERYPQTNVNIDVKSDEALWPFIDLMSKRNDLDRMCFASFSTRRIKTLRSVFGTKVATSATPGKIVSLSLCSHLGISPKNFGLQTVSRQRIYLQIPRKDYVIVEANPRLVAYAHELNMPVFAWGVETEKQYQNLKEYSVDAVFTDHVKELVAWRKKHLMLENQP